MWRLPFFEIPSERQSAREAIREIKASYRLEVEVVKRLTRNHFAVTRHRVKQVVIHFQVTGGRMLSRPGREYKWLSPNQLSQIPQPASQKGIPSLLHNGFF